MRIAAERRIREFCEKYPDAEANLLTFLRVAKKATWTSIQDLRRTYPHADPVEVDSGRTVTVLNVRGNRYRLILAIHYNAGRLYVLGFLPHAQYGTNSWKESL